jgi:hypothetical protein
MIDDTVFSLERVGDLMIGAHAQVAHREGIRAVLGAYADLCEAEGADVRCQYSRN